MKALPRDGRAVAAAAAPPLLEVEDLVTQYPIPRGILGTIKRRPRLTVHAVDGVSFSVGEGEMVALVGESGCGKTSTAQTVIRMVESNSGSIRFRGTRAHAASAPATCGRSGARSRSSTRIPTSRSIPASPCATRSRSRSGCTGSRTSASAREAKVHEAMERAGLTPPELFIDRFPHELSGGQRQRVAIAAALVLEPKLLIADEPVSMLDVSVRAGILALLDSLRRDGMGVLMITHDLSTAAHFADRIAVMYLGRIVEEGPARDVVRNPQHPYTKALISVVPRRDPDQQTTPQILKGETPNPVHVPSGCRFHPRCPVVVDRCREIDPELRGIAGVAPEHRAACILLDDA